MEKLNENIFHQYNKWKTGYVRKENSLQMRLNNFLTHFNAPKSYTKNFSISEDGTCVNCTGDVFIYDENLINGKLPIPFGKVDGEFDCSGCKELISLEGAPKEVGGHFFAYDCSKLTSLEGAPKEVGGDVCIHSCSNLTSLEGTPEKVGDNFDCSECPNLTSLEGAPKEVSGWFTCRNCKNIKSLEGAPKKSVLCFVCMGCKSLTSLEHLPKNIGELMVDRRFEGQIPSDINITKIQYC